MTSAGYVKALVSIHTTSDINSPHIDYPDVQNVKIHSTENYGETGTLQLINRYNDPTKNLLTDTCALWSDGTPRKINHSMFLRIYANERTEDNAIGVYLLASLTVSDDLITVTFCDSVQYLRSIGSEYVKNHYEGAATWHSHYTKWDATNNCGVIEHPSDVTVHGGSYGDVKFYKKFTTSNTESVMQGIYFNNGDTISIVKTLPSDATVFVKIGVKLSARTSTNASATFEFKAYHYNSSTGNKGDLLVQSEVVVSGINVWVYMGMQYVPDINRTLYDSIIVEIKDVSGNGIIEIKKESTAGIKIYLNGNDQNATPTNIFTFAKSTTAVEGQSLTTTLWKINTVDGNAITEDEFTPNWATKAQLFYVDTGSKVAADTIFDRILQAFKFTSMGSIGQRGVNMFRCNGDFLHNYLLALADMPDNEGEDIGRQYGFCSSPYVWNRLLKGKRYTKSDTSFKSFHYPGNTVLDSTPFESFNPSITLKNHPRIAVAKGTGENDIPIMIALPDPNASIGASIPSVNGSITTPVEGALAVYSSIMTNKSEDWQGEMTLTGIDMDVMTEYGYVGGIPIRITDSRYGFASYEAKVKEAEWDFANQTTTITINNYSEMYSNAILDTTKMAYSSGDMSAEASNKDMFCRQYVLIDFSNSVMKFDINPMTIPLNGSSGVINNAQKIEFPELNRMLVYGYFEPGNGVSTEQYGVQGVIFRNVFHPIYNEALRPDKYANQSLIVNMLFKMHE